MNNNKNKGNIYELKAVHYLEKKGYKILHRNLKVSYKEVDIVCEKNNTIVIVEVKYRSSIFPSISYSQQQNILSVIANKYMDKFCRVDFIFFNKKGNLYHLINVVHDE